MTTKAILKEIEKRIEELDARYEKLYHQFINYKLEYNQGGMDTVMKERMRVSIELEGLKAAKRALTRGY